MAFVDQLLAAGETVLHRTRRHWVVLLRGVASALVLIVLGAVMAILFGLRTGSLEAAGAGAWAGVALAVIGLLVAARVWVGWSNEIYLVTNRRAIRVEGVLGKRALDSFLSKVNDVRLTQTLTGRLLGYGTLEIMTASESGIDRLDYLPRPLEFKQALMGAAEGLLGREAQPRQAEMPAERPPAYRSAADRLAELEALHQRGLVNDDEYRAQRAAIVADV